MSTPALPWNTNVSIAPLGKPVLYRLKASDEKTPFMGIRDEDDPESISYILGPTESSYGIYRGLDEVEAWLDVTGGPTA